MVYDIEWRNPSKVGDPLFSIRQTTPEAAHKSALASFADTKASIKESLESRIKRLQQELAVTQHNLTHLDTMYVELSPIAEHLKAQYSQLVDVFRALRQTPGRLTVGALTVYNDYLDVGPSLYVFSLPEWDAVTRTFDVESCELLDQAMAEAGLQKTSDWNGPGLHTRSVRVNTLPLPSPVSVN